MLFVELFNPPLLRSSDLMSFLFSGFNLSETHLFLIYTDFVGQIMSSSGLFLYSWLACGIAIQRCKVQVQKVKVLLSILFQSPGFANSAGEGTN